MVIVFGGIYHQEIKQMIRAAMGSEEQKVEEKAGKGNSGNISGTTCISSEAAGLKVVANYRYSCAWLPFQGNDSCRDGFVKAIGRFESERIEDADAFVKLRTVTSSYGEQDSSSSLVNICADRVRIEAL